MNIQRFKTISIYIVVLILYALSCSESLPPHEEPEVIFELNFRLIGNSAYIPYPVNTPLATRFTFDFRHLFDETLTGEYYRRGYIDIWLADKPLVKKHFEFFDYDPKKIELLDPKEWYDYRYSWDQIFDDGSILYEHLSRIPTTTSPPVPIKVKAKGEIQISTKYNTVLFDEIEFIVYYYKPPPGKISNPNEIFGKEY